MFCSVRFFLRTLPVQILAVAALFAAPAALAEDFNFPGLKDTVTVYEDALGIPTIKGTSEEDVAFVQGYIQARDRFFQMDFSRKLAQGRVSELVGEAGLGNDIEFRTLGFSRAALRTWQAMDSRTKGLLQAYANGVNAWLSVNPLPPEYAGLELTQVDPWIPYDTICYGKVIAAQLSFNLNDLEQTILVGAYRAVGNAVGFDGLALALNDILRSQPIDGRVSVPNFLDGIGGIGAASDRSKAELGTGSTTSLSPDLAPFPEDTLKLARTAQERLSRAPILSALFDSNKHDNGSNEWAVSGAFTESGYPLVANDPHLPLDTPAIFHESSLVYDLGEDSYSVSGTMFPGGPGQVIGCNDRICWGATVHPMDVTDIFRDTLLTNALGLPTHSVHSGQAEPLQTIIQSYFVNVTGDGVPDNIVRAPVSLLEGGGTVVSPRRNYGPMLVLDGNTALFVQYTGWGPTSEVKFFNEVTSARNLDEFVAALQDFDVGSENWIYADVDGNIAYLTSAENPIRADMAAGTIDGGIPPSLIRDGSGALNHEWLPVMNPQPGQALPYEIMPFDEMPQVVNPPWGYIANANNDPIGVTLDNNPFNQLRPGGNGLYYLTNFYADFRQGRVDRVLKGMVESDQPITAEDMMILQANNQSLDAELTLPALLAAMAPVDAPAGSPLAQALDVLSTWDYSTPTGLAEGWDAGDDPNMAVEPDMEEVRNSAAATVFALWRSMLVQNTIDATLTAVGLGDYLPEQRLAHRAFAYHLLNYPTNGGFGASGLNFFSAGLTETVAGSLQQALDLLASDEFAPAFANSTNVMEYAWGKLHRIVFAHPLGVDPFNVPNGGGLTDLAPDLPGLARQGGWETVDASGHSSRADGLNEFMFDSGPSRRFIGEMTPDGVVGYNVLPGGQSGVFYHPNYASQLPLWLTNSYHEFPLGEQDGIDSAIFVHTFNPVP
jgi:penicillin amidase